VPDYGFCTITHDGASVPAVLSDGWVTPLAAVASTVGAPAPPDSVRGLLAEWDRWCDVVETATERDAAAVPADQVTFQPPIPDPSAVYCAGANYYDHLEEMGGKATDKSELATFHFLTAPSALSGHGAPVRRPAGCEYLDWEIELAVVIGRRAVDLAPEQAMAHVAGYTIANDVSAREYVKQPNPALGIDWLRHKSFATLLPVGPAVVPARLVPDPMDLPLRLLVNGEKRQDSSTDKMIFSVAEQISALSRIAPLLPGDVVLTGTPAGTAAAHGRYLQPGDVMAAEIAGLGRLENTVEDSV
jgi:2-keto-4-pentenoate hydratase/2-oxohepta-3-ene-1,7-dioic acid hydratase in catechol pathway